MSTAGHTQNCNLSIDGKVSDTDTKEILPYATIINTNNGAVYLASDKGCFLIKNICPNDTVHLICQHQGCEAKKFKFTITKDSSIVLDMPHHTHTYDDISIILDQHDDENTQANSSLEGTELDRQKGKTLGEALKKINGVTVLQTGNSISKPIIHGMHSQRVQVFNNDIQLQNQSWGSEHAPEIDPYLANKITVIKGAGSLRYSSSAVGGIILIEPKPLTKTPGLAGNLYLTGNSNGKAGSSSIDLEGNHKKLSWLSWRIQGSTKRGGNSSSPNYYLKNTGYRESNFSYAISASTKKIGIEAYYSLFNSEIGIFSASHIANLTDLELAFTSPTPLETSGFSYNINRPFQQIYHELLKIKSFWWIGEESKLSLILSRQFNNRSEYDKIHNQSDESIPNVKFDLTSHNAELVLENHIHELLSSTIGLQIQSQFNTSDGSRYLIPDFTNMAYSAYAIERFDRHKTSLELGLRYENRANQSWIWQNNKLENPIVQFGNLVYNIGGIYRFEKGLDLHINFGSTWRSPTPNELYSDGVHHGAASIEQGDSDLTYEYAKEASLQFNYHKEDRLITELTFYQKLINNYIYLTPTGQTELTIRGAFPVFKYEQDHSIFQGIDFGLSYRLLQRLKWNLKSSIVRAFKIETQEFLPFIPSDRIYNGLRYSFKRQSKIKNGFLEMGVENIAKQTRVLDGSDFVDPPSGYTIVQFNSGVTLVIGKQRIDLGFEINNLLNTKYRDYMNRFRYFSDDIGRSFIINLKLPFSIKSPKHEL